MHTLMTTTSALLTGSINVTAPSKVACQRWHSSLLTPPTNLLFPSSPHVFNICYNIITPMFADFRHLFEICDDIRFQKVLIILVFAGVFNSSVLPLFGFLDQQAVYHLRPQARRLQTSIECHQCRSLRRILPFDRIFTVGRGNIAQNGRSHHQAGTGQSFFEHREQCSSPKRIQFS